MTDHTSETENPSETDNGARKTTGASPLPIDVERLSAYAWQRGAIETIVFQGAARLTTAAGPLDLESGTWLLARWAGLTLEDIPDGELVCILPERA